MLQIPFYFWCRGLLFCSVACSRCINMPKHYLLTVWLFTRSYWLYHRDFCPWLDCALTVPSVHTRVIDPPQEGVCGGGEESALYLPPTTHRPDETAIAYLLSYSNPLDPLKKYIWSDVVFIQASGKVWGRGARIPGTREKSCSGERQTPR